MVSANLLLKILGGVTIAAVGTTGAYFLFTSSSSDAISNKAIESTTNWEVTSTPDKVEKDNTPVEINVRWKDGDKSWECKIKGNVKSYTSGNTLDIKSQAETLKKELGITDDKKRNKNKNHNFKKFIEGCKKYKTKSTNTSFVSVIDLKDITANDQKKYQFKDEDLKKLYNGTSEILKSLGIGDKELNKDHTLDKSSMEKIKFEGKTSLVVSPSDASVKLKIEKTNDLPEGLKFTFTADKETKLQQGTDDKSPITLEANKGMEYKVKITEEGAYSLEKKS